jgi:hypothetical protein
MPSARGPCRHRPRERRCGVSARLCQQCHKRPVMPQGKAAGPHLYCRECWDKIEAEMATDRADQDAERVAANDAWLGRFFKHPANELLDGSSGNTLRQARR